MTTTIREIVHFSSDRETQRGLFVGVFGNIASGKTWLCEALAHAAPGRVALFYEPVDSRSFRRHLAAFNDDRRERVNRGNAFAMQVYVLRERLRDHRAAAALRDLGWTCVQDQPVYGDTVFAANAAKGGFMSPSQYADYAGLATLIGWEIQPPDVLVYCDTPVADCLANIGGRGRPEEVGTPAEYLEGLRGGFDALADRLAKRGVPVLRTAWRERDGGTAVAVAEELWRRVREMAPPAGPEGAVESGAARAPLPAPRPR